MQKRKLEDGFSLIEALVALTILAVSAGTLLAAVEEHTHAIAAISDRTTARWIAENRLIELSLAQEEIQENSSLDGQDWWITTERSETPDPDLIRVDISVGLMFDPSAALVRLTGYIDEAETRE
jgi:general secretion pathway protein I